MRASNAGSVDQVRISMLRINQATSRRSPTKHRCRRSFSSFLLPFHFFNRPEKKNHFCRLKKESGDVIRLSLIRFNMVGGTLAADRWRQRSVARATVQRKTRPVERSIRKVGAICCYSRPGNWTRWPTSNEFFSGILSGNLLRRSRANLHPDPVYVLTWFKVTNVVGHSKNAAGCDASVRHSSSNSCWVHRSWHVVAIA